MRSRPHLLLVAFLASAPGAAAQTWYESYHSAEDALAREEWSEAVRHLNLAIRERPESSARVRTYGMRFIAYFPYLKLGQAYFHLGQTEAALSAFETEERQGEIESSSEASTELRAYRARVAAALAEATAARERRSREVAMDNLERSRRLEEEGRFQEALSTLQNALAVDPDDTEAQAARRRLLEAITAEERARARAERFSSLLARGRAYLESGDFRAAASSLSEALELETDRGARALLDQAQAGIRSELERSREEVGDAAERHDRRLVAASLERAVEHESRGELALAMSELQAALAIDPENRDARALQRRVSKRQREAEEADSRQETAKRWLGEAEASLARGELNGALVSANRALAAEPENRQALSLIARTYAKLSDSLLTTDNAPPSILLDDRGEEVEGELRRIVQSPELRLSGTVYDNTPVEVALMEGSRYVAVARSTRRQFQGVWVTEFVFEHVLPAGVSNLEVAATDRGGRTTREPYVVEYVVPFSRTAWFPVSLGAGTSALALALLGGRVRRRRQLLRRRFNPYIAGAPILERERFFGREALLEYVLRRIHNNSVLLYGERRIGKTSLQHQLKKRLSAMDDSDYTFYPVYIDLQGTPEEKFFATLAGDLFDELAPFLEGLTPSAPLDDGYGYRNLVQDLHAVLRVLKGRTTHRVKLVLLIDEVDELNDYDPRVNQRLRSLFMRTFAENLVSVVSGVAIKKHWEREGSPWYNFFQEIEVKPLEADEASRLIEAPVRGVFAFDQGVKEEILRRTGGKPYLVQRICSQLVEKMHEEHRVSFTLADVETVCQAEGV